MGILRRPGSPWRILVHEWLGGDGGQKYGTSYDVSNDPDAPVKAAEIAQRLYGKDTPLPLGEGAGQQHTVIEGTEFDELVIGQWIHLEQMDDDCWWVNIGGVTVNVTADADGRPKTVTVFGPHDYDAPREGCLYECMWSEPATDAQGK